MMLLVLHQCQTKLRMAEYDIYQHLIVLKLAKADYYVYWYLANIKQSRQWQNMMFIGVWTPESNQVTVKILKFGTPQTIAIIVLKLVKFDVTLH